MKLKAPRTGFEDRAFNKQHGVAAADDRQCQNAGVQELFLGQGGGADAGYFATLLK